MKDYYMLLFALFFGMEVKRDKNLKEHFQKLDLETDLFPMFEKWAVEFVTLDPPISDSEDFFEMKLGEYKSLHKLDDEQA